MSCNSLLFSLGKTSALFYHFKEDVWDFRIITNQCRQLRSSRQARAYQYVLAYTWTSTSGGPPHTHNVKTTLLGKHRKSLFGVNFCWSLSSFAQTFRFLLEFWDIFSRPEYFRPWVFSNGTKKSLLKSKRHGMFLTSFFKSLPLLPTLHDLYWRREIGVHFTLEWIMWLILLPLQRNWGMCC